MLLSNIVCIFRKFLFWLFKNFLATRIQKVNDCFIKDFFKNGYIETYLLFVMIYQPIKYKPGPVTTVFLKTGFIEVYNRLIS